MFAVAMHRAMPAVDIEKLLRQYSVQEYHKAKEVLANARLPSSQRRSFLRNPIGSLKKILGRWLDKGG